MPNKCSIINCNGNYDKENKCRVFKLPKEEVEKQAWINVIPPRKDFVIVSNKFFICERHWPSESTPYIKLPGGFTRPATPPSIFNVPRSCLPSPKPAPRKPKQQDEQLKYFLKKDLIHSFRDFSPDKDLKKKYDNVIIHRSDEKFVCIFMTKDFQESHLTVIVWNKATLCSPLTLSAFKNGISIPSVKILNPNNGLNYYSQFFEAVHVAYNYNLNVDDVINKVVLILKDKHSELEDGKKAEKLQFITRQLQLLTDKTFSVADYCLAIESFPNCDYERLRDFLVLPSERKLQSVVSSLNMTDVLKKTLQKVKSEKQKNVVLLVDEVKIRPTVSFSNGLLKGVAKNDPDSKATSMLCVMMKCLHAGPSIMVSVTPVNKLTAEYQYEVVKEAAALVEQSGWTVLGSITDNHKINQKYCTLFNRVCDSQAIHPLDDTRIWYLLFDTVHLLKCIRNNWITEKTQKISLDKKSIASFSDVKDLYNAEKDNILKTTPLTYSAICPSKLQLQNVQHVLKIFNDRVVAALTLQGAAETASFVTYILNWWKTVNVNAKGRDVRLNDPYRCVQDQSSDNLQVFLKQFKEAESGQGATRIQCLTNDTKKALVQTTEGMIALCKHLFTIGFDYVLLREIQSDRIEGEFSVYRQSTGGNAFMTTGDVSSAFRKRLARFAASFLQSIESDTSNENCHTCVGPITAEDASSIEECISDVSLSCQEERSAAYVAGWLEKKCEGELKFSEDELLITNEMKDFIDEVSRGSLTIPHMCTYELVRSGLRFVKKARNRACCCQRLMNILSIVDAFYDLGLSSKKLFRHLSNVLLKGLHNLHQDNQKNAVLYQTSIKKARLAN